MEKILAIVCRSLNWNVDLFMGCAPLWDGTAAQLCALTPEFSGHLPNIDQALSQAEQVLKHCQSQGFEILHPRDEFYPARFREIAAAPVFITYFGDVELLQKSSLSVVGSRQPLPWIEAWLEQEMLPYIQTTKIQVVSGGAIGVDQLAHNLALRAQSSTIAILPSGLSCLYPRNIQRYVKYAHSGQWGFLSEYFPEQSMRTFHFHHRNRLISAFSPALFVVQAHCRSGSMITAQLAADQGREIFTLVNSPLEPATLGNLQLLYDGAHMLRWGSDLPQFCPPEAASLTKFGN